MKTVRILFLFTCASVMIWSCQKDNFGSAPVDPNKPVSFSKEVLPILVTECAKSGCHVTGVTSPDLSAANAYDELTTKGYVPTDGIDAEKCKLYVRMTSFSNPMPKSGVLPASKTNLILYWVKQGALNN